MTKYVPHYITVAELVSVLLTLNQTSRLAYSIDNEAVEDARRWMTSINEIDAVIDPYDGSLIFDVQGRDAKAHDCISLLDWQQGIRTVSDDKTNQEVTS